MDEYLLEASQKAEEDARKERIHAIQNEPTIEPKLWCKDCHDIVNKGKACKFYADCLQDWQRIENANHRNGKG